MSTSVRAPVATSVLQFGVGAGSNGKVPAAVSVVPAGQGLARNEKVGEQRIDAPSGELADALLRTWPGSASGRWPVTT